MAKTAKLPKWGDRHYCPEQDAQSIATARQEPKIELKWYGWALEFKLRVDDIQINYCPWCGQRLVRT